MTIIIGVSIIINLILLIFNLVDVIVLNLIRIIVFNFIRVIVLINILVAAFIFTRVKVLAVFINTLEIFFSIEYLRRELIKDIIKIEELYIISIYYFIKI